MMLSKHIIVLLLLSARFCTFAQSADVRLVAAANSEKIVDVKAADLADIQEALFRHLLPKDNNPPDPEIHIYFVSVIDRSNGKEGDPMPEFIKRLADTKLRLEGASQAKTSEKGAFDKSTGERGMIISVGEVRWTSEDKVEVAGSWFVGGLGAGGSTYVLQKKDGKWTVVKETQNWIS